MKCSKCGASLKDIKAMGAHYRKHHPAAMKAKGPRKTRAKSSDAPYDLYMKIRKWPHEDRMTLYHLLEGGLGV
jgi:hypothetical protein